MRSQLYRSALLSSLALATTGCGLISFDVSSALSTASVPAGPSGTSLDSLQQPTTIDPQDTGPADSAKLKSLTFAATAGGTFDFLQEVHLFVSAPGLPEVEVANLVKVPRGQTDLSMDVLPNVELLPYVKAGFTLRTAATGDLPTQAFSFGGELVAHIGV